MITKIVKFLYLHILGGLPKSQMISNLEDDTYNAALSSGSLDSHTKNPMPIIGEIISGAITVTELHPSMDPEVTAKINTMRVAFKDE